MRGSVIKYIFLAALIILGAVFFLYYTRVANQGELLVTRLDSIRGIKFIGPASDILRVLLMAVFLNLINIGLAAKLAMREKFAAILFPIFTLLLNLLLLIYILFIVSIN